jgi:hypothetical protein
MLPFVLLLIGTAGLTMAWCVFIRRRGSRGWRTLRGLAAWLVAYGVVTLFAQILVVPWGMGLIGPEIEWPIGLSSRAVRDSQGRYIVPHPSSGRVQVYDADLRFERGWFVEDDAVIGKVRVADGDRVEVFTSRDRRRLLYSPDGTLLQQDTFEPQEYKDIATGPQFAVDVGTPWLLRPFAHPLYGMGMMVLGALALAGLDRVEKRSRVAQAGIAPETVGQK